MSPAELRRTSPEEIDVSVASTAPGLLVVSEHYDPGWSAWIDGRPAAVLETDLMVLSVPVPAGQHQVRLRFRPAGLLPGFFCAIATALLLAMLALRSKKRAAKA